MRKISRMKCVSAIDRSISLIKYEQKLNPNILNFKIRRIGHIAHYHDLIKIIPRNKETKQVLEIGLGHGQYLASCLKMLFDFDIHAIEHPDSNYLENLGYQKLLKLNKVDLKFCDIIYDKIPFNKKFDLIFLSEVFEHIPLIYLEPVLEKISKALKPNGYFVLTTPNLFSLKNRLLLLFGYEIFKLPKPQGGQRHIREYSFGEVKGIAKPFFKVVHVKYSNFHYSSYYLYPVVWLANLFANVKRSFKGDIMILFQKRGD